MAHYSVFQRTAQDREVFEDSRYPWAALLLAPLWAFRKGLAFHGVVLLVLYGFCVLLMGVANNGIIAGGGIALWLGVFTAHNATDWLTVGLEKRGYRRVGAVKADSAEDALRAFREPKGHRVLLENVCPTQLSDGRTVEHAESVA